MNERYGRDYDNDEDNGMREDWEDRSQLGRRTQRDSSRGEMERGNWGRGRSSDQSAGERLRTNPGLGRSSPGQGARYGSPQYERGEPYSGEYGGGYYGSGGYSGGGYGGGSSTGGSSAGGSYQSGGFRGQYGQSGGGTGQSGYGQRGQSSYGQGGQHDRFSEGGAREENWGTRWPSNDRSEGAGNYGTRREGGFFGKGPKGYTRSDERIREDVCDRLSDDDEVDASDITVTVKNAEVTLEGTVPDRRSKHRAEDIAEAVGGVRDVHNSLRSQKGLLQEMGDRVTGRAESEQHGHTGSGTRNSGASSSNATTQGSSAGRT